MEILTKRVYDPYVSACAATGYFTGETLAAL